VRKEETTDGYPGGVRLNAGARPAERDLVDARGVEDITQGDGTIRPNVEVWLASYACALEPACTSP
jgi:hypothetical protein